MRIALGADHAGFTLKEELATELVRLGYEVVDVGATHYDAVDDYPDFAEKVGEALVREEAVRGIVVCGSGIGASIAANKIPGIRAGLATDTYSARQGVEHDDMNVLVLGARVTGVEVIKEIVKSFLGAEFSGEDRHVRRLNKVIAIERRHHA
jgi:RpiB/LacA/LacB family sugar-phosphate isomerase